MSKYNSTVRTKLKRTSLGPLLLQFYLDKAIILMTLRHCRPFLHDLTLWIPSGLGSQLGPIQVKNFFIYPGVHTRDLFHIVFVDADFRDISTLM